ncbi:TIGR04219 family outer membrane beta-barrel protein [Alteromonas sediminis]|uniref:TIGR04219 family outer membrane beta-barrel protein n=1 Tax=Alteromonas sediminis TaxID=2259342 RepID=A0A3N5Z6Q4_9ALTE|nr:TIGR04219 family outer membrane beta-barrel protein [Alteromonas sediminis]RPJ66254.1 TIGR04219 family outer membrane beta-barrel protein [Alteromonas sediminis]
MKMHYAIALSGLLCSFSATADTVFGIYLGAQGWNTDATGRFADEGDAGSLQSDFNFGDETKGSAYIAIEHFVPLVPNIKLQHSQMVSEGDTLLSSSFTFGGQAYNAQTTVFTQTDISSTDIILYYELFDNDLISFDLGVNAKVIDGDFLVRSQSSGSQSQEALSGVVPMAYSRLEFGLPFSGLGAYAEGSFLSVGSHTLSDYQVAVTYSFIESLAIDMTLQAGFRDVTAELDDLDGITTDLSFDGAFLGLEVHF